MNRRKSLILGTSGVMLLGQHIRGWSTRCAEPTLHQVEGPFYRPNSPLANNLSLSGELEKTINISGRVLNIYCEPVKEALVEFWHTSPQGVYDNQGFLYRGRQFTDNFGFYHLTTHMPGSYFGRTKHIHVKIRTKNKLLTTQLYFGDEPLNNRDYFFNKKLLLSETYSGYKFDFYI
ncbi:MAG: hypothetical protein CBC42_01320 [Betaproteobacteria bacterium TMED82]|nr:MAG: hypothetical protein CBC42_01320 [Betaproteobacteria bacterium TMED82]|tara:strand:+ start:13641 stop:14168 length:528 start_codon:yes stop_codon:yes gene_type:complete